MDQHLFGKLDLDPHHSGKLELDPDRHQNEKQDPHPHHQGCESGSVSGSRLDPDSIGSVDPDSETGSGSRRAKITHKSREKKIKKFHVLKCWMAFFES